VNLRQRYRRGSNRRIDVYRVRAFIYYEQKNWDAALDDVRKALEISPNDLQFLKGLGEIDLARNDMSGAWTHLSGRRDRT
jgi:tetratricopeptide (TPR) repeat protein